MRPLVVELLYEIIEFALLLQTVHARGPGGFRFESEMHALMTAIREASKHSGLQRA